MTALAGGGVFVLGAIALGVDAYRFRDSLGFTPDDDPEREEIEPTAEIIEIQTSKHYGKTVGEAA